ncbi:MAG: fibro-slime domain-containing protein [Deltaproteobacteria bacterium]|nr:fibro-slime domain-containing protein [Deltaproteobacteria bacterium]
MNGERKTQLKTLGLIAFLLFGLTFVLVSACDSSSTRGTIPGGGDGDSDSDGDGDSDSDGDGDGDYDFEGNTVVDVPSGYNPDEGDCDNFLRVVFRDFKASHPDFERSDLGWGPALGLVQSNLNSDRKPVWKSLWGDAYVADMDCQSTCPNGGSVDKAELEGTIYTDQQSSKASNGPMWTAADTFKEWYTDVDGVNMRIEKLLVLEEDGSGNYSFNSEYFFPLGDNDGFGFEGQRDANGDERNFLFTTEVHTKFTYEGGEEFMFSGDDDLWIFVDGELALDLGGLHWPFRDTIVFDNLGLTKGETYDMDIFHAERHTEASNFRIETNIKCFSNIVAE